MNQNFSSMIDRYKHQQLRIGSVSPQQMERQTATATVEKNSFDLEKAFKNSFSSASNTSVMTAWGLSYNPSWSDFTAGSRMIHQFIPLPDVSSFFAKLKTFGEEK